MAHTPGPWTINDAHEVIATSERVPVADCGFVNRSDADNDANARLIAAAPKLLAALRALVAFDSRAYVKQSDLAKDLLAARKAALLAIARATAP